MRTKAIAGCAAILLVIIGLIWWRTGNPRPNPTSSPTPAPVTATVQSPPLAASGNASTQSTPNAASLADALCGTHAGIVLSQLKARGSALSAEECRALYDFLKDPSLRGPYQRMAAIKNDVLSLLRGHCGGGGVGGRSRTRAASADSKREPCQPGGRRSRRH